MKEYVFLFRNDYNADFLPTPEQMQAMTKKWIDWVNQIAAQGKLSSRGNRLGMEGKTVKPGNVVTDGPYMELKEFVGGFIAVKAASIEEATEMAMGCPILTVGGSVEVRDVVPMNG